MRFLTTVVLLAALVLVAACSGAASSTVGGTVSVHGTATAGPVCPVEKPGDSACAPRPVAGATLVVKTAAGAEVARVTTGSDGSFAVSLAPGSYVLFPQPVNGLMGTAQPIPLTVAAGTIPEATPITVEYDTGIR